MIQNLNPKYWRSPTQECIIDFEKAAFISRTTDGDPIPPGAVKVCLVFERTHAPVMIYMPRDEFVQLLGAYERWLSER